MASMLQQPDRSGEATFRKVLADLGSLKGVGIRVARSIRDTKGGAFQADRQYMVWYQGPTQFRVVVGSYWGDGMTLVADSKVCSQDNGDESQPITLRNVTQSLVENCPDLETKAGYGALFFTLLKGDRAFDQIVAPDGQVKLVGNTLEVKTRDIGSLRITLIDGRAVGLEYDNRPALEAAYRLNPLWNAPVDDPMVREEWTITTREKMPKGLFDTSVPSGRAIDDRRNKKPPL